AIVRWSGIDGYSIKNSNALLTDDGELSLALGLLVGGDIDLGTNDITNVNLVDGVDVSDHASRHESGGDDELDGYNIAITYTPVNYNAPAVDIIGAHFAEIDEALSTIVTDHGALSGLSDDDHTQYILVDGTRAFTGEIDLGSNDITNVNLV